MCVTECTMSFINLFALDTFLEFEMTQARMSDWSRVLHQPQILDSGVLKRGLIKTVNGEESVITVRRIHTS